MQSKRTGNNIRILRKNYGMTQAELAEETGVSADHISHVEIGCGNISVPLLIKICKMLAVTPNDVLAGVYEETSEADIVYRNSIQDKVLPLKNLDTRDMILLDYIYQFIEKRK